MITVAHSVDQDAQSTRMQIVLEQSASAETASLLIRPPADDVVPDADMRVLADPIGAGETVVKSHRWKEGWDRDDDRRFTRLALREASGDLTAEESGELDELQMRRRSFKSPRLLEDVVFDHKRNQILRELERSLRAYVEFVRP